MNQLKRWSHPVFYTLMAYHAQVLETTLDTQQQRITGLRLLPGGVNATTPSSHTNDAL